MTPTPVQHAVAVALGDEVHVQEQAMVYAARRKRLAPALTSMGFAVDFSEAGLYIWCSNGEEDWAQVAWFAERGILVLLEFLRQRGRSPHKNRPNSN